MKRCSRCGEEKDLPAFPRNKGRTSGCGAYCRLCQNAIQRQWRLSNLDRSHRLAANWRARNKDKILAKSKAEYAANPEREAWRLRRWRVDHPEEFLRVRARAAIMRRIGGSRKTDIPDDLINAKAAIMRVKDEIKSIRKHSTVYDQTHSTGPSQDSGHE